MKNLKGRGALDFVMLTYLSHKIVSICLLTAPWPHVILLMLTFSSDETPTLPAPMIFSAAYTESPQRAHFSDPPNF